MFKKERKRWNEQAAGQLMMQNQVTHMIKKDFYSVCGQSLNDCFHIKSEFFKQSHLVGEDGSTDLP